MISKFFRRGPVLAAVAVVAALVLGACGSNGTVTPSSDSTGTPTQGGSVTFAISTYPAGLDAALLSGRGNLAAYQIVDTLTSVDPDTGEIKPYLAKSWTVSDDAQTFTFELRDDVTFSDGTPFNAQSVKTNLDTLAELNGEGKTDTLVRSALATYSGTTVIGDFTVEVAFSSPQLGFLRNASDPYLGFYAEATLAKSAEERTAGDLIGSGPFTYGEIVQNESIQLVAREDYNWGPAVASHTGRAHLDTVLFKVVPESGVRAGLISSGQADIVDDVAVQDEPVITGAGASLLYRAVPGLLSGFRQNPFSRFGSDVVVRKALTKAIDRAELRDTLLSPETTELVTSVIAGATPLWADQSEHLAHDPEGAKKLLEKAGWTEGADGIRVRAGERLSLKVIFPTNSLSATREELELIQAQVKKVGIDLQLLPVTAADFTAHIMGIAEAGADNAVYDFLSGSGPSQDPSFLVGLFKNTNPALGGADQPELEAAADALAGATNEEERAKAAADLQALLARDGYWIPIKEITKVLGVAPHVQGLKLNGYATPIFYDASLKN